MTDWRERSQCKPEDMHLFFPDDDDYSAINTLQAKTLCAACPVREQCLTFALGTQEKWGVFGGQTPAQRGVKAPKKLDEDVVLNPNWCLGGCGYTMPRHTMAWLLPEQRNYYAQGRCANCYKRDARLGGLEITTERSTFNASTDDPR